MTVTVTNAQHEAPVNKTRMAQVATQAVRALRIRSRGTLAIPFLGRRQIRALNRRFLRHDRPTDVLSFRYNNVRGSGFPEPIVGEIFIAPALARAYARTHAIPYSEELARYVVHGILHWLGHEDKTVAQQRRMREREDRLLTLCGVRLSPPTPNPQPRTSRNGHSHR
ncbi:MAG: rRNA maturation RNase YbeY [Omnitrophica WOR_2 bacterium RIFCSPHIGHO2_02_FULL_67_20]|nr:MAG: rRNA maturation RNase YbeY [Omnitrophica WOR_2 bacterium RIFCSPHIGHO2_02_FULL_67_20]